MGWVREGHTAPWFHGGETPQLLCPSMGQFLGVFRTVPQASSDTGLLPPTVVTCPLSHPLLAFLSWLTSPIPHNASWDDLPNSLLLTMWKFTHPKVFPLEDYFSMGADFALAKSGDISGCHNPMGGGAVGIWQAGAKNPTTHGKGPHSQGSSSPESK